MLCTAMLPLQRRCAVPRCSRAGPILAPLLPLSQLLIEGGAQPGHCTKAGDNACHLSAARAHGSCLKAICQSQVAVDMAAKGSDGRLAKVLPPVPWASRVWGSPSPCYQSAPSNGAHGSIAGTRRRLPVTRRPLDGKTGSAPFSPRFLFEFLRSPGLVFLMRGTVFFFGRLRRWPQVHAVWSRPAYAICRVRGLAHSNAPAGATIFRYRRRTRRAETHHSPSTWGLWPRREWVSAFPCISPPM